MRAIEDARAACESHRWGDAWRLLTGVEVDALDVDDLDRLATAAYLTGHDEEAVAHWTRAHQICVRDGEVHRAVHFGTKLAQALGFKGDLARAKRLGYFLDSVGERTRHTNPTSVRLPE